MSDQPNFVTFLPYLRQGLATKLNLAAGSGQARGRMDITLQVTGEGINGSTLSADPISHTVQILGPGDVIGIDSQVILRTEPRDWITNFEPNYLAHVEFYDEDFPWRYTPLASSNKLTPWLTLLVLKDGDDATKEFKDLPLIPGQPLPSILVKNKSLFPNASGLWAWAHVQVNSDLAPGSLKSNDTTAIDHTLQTNPDLAYSRLLSPRHLEPNTAYYACLIPTFEVGRLAGLGKEVKVDADGSAIAWSGSDLSFPVYHRWYFRTGEAGDFEQLVRDLKPVLPNREVGVRPMQVRARLNRPPRDYDFTVELGGALQVPGRLPMAESVQAKSFSEDLAKLINLSDDYQAAETNDPLITAPLYGCWHALLHRLLVDRLGNPLPNTDNWIHQLNGDARFRVPSGFGTWVVQENQEALMRSAWDQLGDVLEANRRIRLAQAAREMAVLWHRRHLRSLQTNSVDRAFLLTAPVHSKVVSGSETIRFQAGESVLSTAALSVGFRRAIRPRGRLMKALKPTALIRRDNLLTRMSQREVSAALPKPPSTGLTSVDELAEASGVHGLSPETQTHPDKNPCINIVRQGPIRTPSKERDQPQRDNGEGRLFQHAICDLVDILTVSQQPDPEPPPPFDIPAATAQVLIAIDPTRTIPNRIKHSIDFPSHVRDELDDRFQEAMAYPRFDKAMYENLSELSTELLLPNINLIEPDSVTALESNNKFIEAYMLGLNHEFGRELLWREYPTDQRGSYFRQFWKADSHFDTEGTEDERRERHYDILPIDKKWRLNTKLGAHNPRQTTEPDLVLVVRGELLKRYPNTVIYAHKARWQLTDGVIDKTKNRVLESPAKIKTPLYEAQVRPDIYFFGFDLTARDAYGQVTADDPEASGWFIVFKERPGEPRFGLDEGPAQPIKTVNDFNWQTPGLASNGFLAADGVGQATIAKDLGLVDQQKLQNQEDATVLDASADSTSARCAYVLLQAPVMVAIHASEIVPPKKAAE